MADDDEDCDRGLAGLSPEFQAMVGGLAGHTASFAKMLEKRTMAAASAKKKDDDTYLESYSDLAIHEDMLKDGPRVDAYRAAIKAYGPEWSASEAGVTVVDVGSGTGLLAIYAAKAGARRVFAVEASRMAHFLTKVVADNAPPGVVEVKECMAEDLDLGSDAPSVDVIVSEWMGYFLLFENMLPSVFAVRDKHLKPGGLMLPSRCKLLVAPVDDKAWRSAKLDFWKNACELDMSSLLPLAVANACDKGHHTLIEASDLLAPPTEALLLDMHTAKESDLRRFEATFFFELESGQRLGGFTSWFDCEFGKAGWLLNTAPDSPPTHWRQTTFHLRDPIESRGGPLRVEVSMLVESHEVYTRGYRVTFEVSASARKKRTETFELR